MNPTLLKDLILAGHRVACKDTDWKRKVFLFINWIGEFEWTQIQHSIESSLSFWLDSESYTEKEVKDLFTWEYKIVTPLPQLPQVWDTVEVLEICRELPEFEEWGVGRKCMVWNKYIVEEISNTKNILIDARYFPSRAVAKCEPEKAQSIESDEKFWDTIVVNWKTYKAI